MLVLFTWQDKHPRSPVALTPGPTWHVLASLFLSLCGAPSFPVADGQLALTPPSTLPFDPPHPAMVFISPGPRCAYLQQALGKMATLGYGQEPPRVPSPVNLASPGTPGTHHREARLHLQGHQHGTHPALCSLRLPAPFAHPTPLALQAGNKAAHWVLTGCWGSRTFTLGSGWAAVVKAGDWAL